MSLHYHPIPGSIVRCDFSRGFVPPEMIKKRPVVVVSPDIHNRVGLCTVVPISSKEPYEIMDYHYEIKFNPALPHPYNKARQWVKCDMIYSVSIKRLDFLFYKNDVGEYKEDRRIISDTDLVNIKECILKSIGL